MRFSPTPDRALQIVSLDAPLLSWITATQGPFDGHSLANVLNESITAVAFNVHNNVSRHIFHTFLFLCELLLKSWRAILKLYANEAKFGKAAEILIVLKLFVNVSNGSRNLKFVLKTHFY